MAKNSTIVTNYDVGLATELALATPNLPTSVISLQSKCRLPAQGISIGVFTSDDQCSNRIEPFRVGHDLSSFVVDSYERFIFSLNLPLTCIEVNEKWSAPQPVPLFCGDASGSENFNFVCGHSCIAHVMLTGSWSAQHVSRPVEL